MRREKLEMAKFWFSGKSVDLPAMKVHPKSESDLSKWQNGMYETVKLTASVEGLRAHTGGKNYPGRQGSKEMGAWVLIGDVIGTSSQIADSRSLPTNNPRSMTAFTKTSEAVLGAGTIVNIGLASALFGGSGGGFQAEYISGPRISFSPITTCHT